ncbi:hypothetical protein BDN70DRAFT_936326 [Pholiota conissans]|uniref:Uncharacterized protein n=1 Tax=Pholiota conissans TaxID=109636 RepID=A0A9P5YST5_9AGAR|nr:hypothetical protein BDN70DRAFT_936326 [Pholiota conissans]
MIATSKASTVLLAFRKKWATVDVVARELVLRGTQFNTVKAVASRPQRTLEELRPLGNRLKGYKPSREDYDEYIRRRDELLRGPKGRAALMHGGIIARLARDAGIEPSVVLGGPVSGDRVVCEYGGKYLVDDQLTENDKNIISGVYFAQTDNSPDGQKLVEGATMELSWWPQDATWDIANCYLTTEWTDLAEVFFDKRKTILQKNELTIPNLTEWRQALRRSNTWTKKIEAGIEHYQSGYLDHFCKSVSRVPRS